MGKCSYCKRKLDFLVYRETVSTEYEVDLWDEVLHYEIEDIIDIKDTVYLCPYCGKILCSNEEEAIRLLNQD